MLSGSAKLINVLPQDPTHPLARIAQCETLHLSTAGTNPPPHYSIRHPPLFSLSFFFPYHLLPHPCVVLTFPHHLYHLPSYRTALSYITSFAPLRRTRNPVLQSHRWPMTGARAVLEFLQLSLSGGPGPYRVELGINQHHNQHLTNDALDLPPAPPPRAALFESDGGQRHIFRSFDMGYAPPSHSQRGFLVHRKRLLSVL